MAFAANSAFIAKPHNMAQEFFGNGDGAIFSWCTVDLSRAMRGQNMKSLPRTLTGIVWGSVLRNALRNSGTDL